MLAESGLLGGTGAAYAVAAAAHLAFARYREWGALARWATRAAYAVHTAALLAVVLATRRFPVYTQFEALFALTWLLALGYLLVEALGRDRASGTFLVPVLSFLVLMGLASAPPVPGMGVRVHLPPGVVLWHVSGMLGGYVFFVSAFVVALMYLLLDYQLRRKVFSPLYYRLPSLETLDLWGYRFVALGFPLMTLGLLSGALFAETLWGPHRWSLDAKVLWTVVTWAVYGGYLLLRRRHGWGGRRSAWWAVGGFVAVVLNYFVINTALTGLHRFGI
ncbi:cytochrome C assembly family protein [Caldinitratiruptor microaerophilus]|uniref:Cytochrome c assembly protein domain-containing protein n=1 Tax=Caldinitratiruptor microaerophilus TaxID=671077 RepID=A0AA35G7E0_9FIRM|nr:cytochrome c biogenesis protein [Caldinitratiruptor microaerophilus]BDG59223.1 hypothetical protein caldi_03130 [Caldinitratiruptor microaerophilus]